MQGLGQGEAGQKGATGTRRTGKDVLEGKLDVAGVQGGRLDE